jgi:anti-anti-sigma factor
MALGELSTPADPRDGPAKRKRAERARTVVWVRGEHDLSTSGALWHTMARAVEAADTDLVVDMSEVEFMGAATVTVVLQAAELLRQQARSLTVRNPSRCALRVLQLCDLTHLVESAPAKSSRSREGLRRQS